MEWKEKKIIKGVLKYRMPDCSEGYEYLALLDTIVTGNDIFKARAKIIKMMDNLVGYKEVGYEQYQDLLNDKDNFLPLGEIANEILNDVTDALGKKI